MVGKSSENRSLLIVDDEQNLLSKLRDQLRKHLIRFVEHDPDVALSDHVTPECV